MRAGVVYVELRLRIVGRSKAFYDFVFLLNVLIDKLVVSIWKTYVQELLLQLLCVL